MSLIVIGVIIIGKLVILMNSKRKKSFKDLIYTNQ